MFKLIAGISILAAAFVWGLMSMAAVSGWPLVIEAVVSTVGVAGGLLVCIMLIIQGAEELRKRKEVDEQE